MLNKNDLLNKNRILTQDALRGKLIGLAAVQVFQLNIKMKARKFAPILYMLHYRSSPLNITCN